MYVGCQLEKSCFVIECHVSSFGQVEILPYFSIFRYFLPIVSCGTFRTKNSFQKYSIKKIIEWSKLHFGKVRIPNVILFISNWNCWARVIIFEFTKYSLTISIRTYAVCYIKWRLFKALCLPSSYANKQFNAHLNDSTCACGYRVCKHNTKLK